MRSHCKRNSVLEWKKVRQSARIGRKTKGIDTCRHKQMKAICKVVCVFVNHVDKCMECKRKESF